MEKQDSPKETKATEERKSTRGFAIPADSFNPNDRSLAEGAD